MNTPQAYKQNFKSPEAFNNFVHEAMHLETNIARHIHHKHCETLYLFADDESGHIVTWYREHDVASHVLDAKYYHAYNKIPWQVTG